MDSPATNTRSKVPSSLLAVKPKRMAVLGDASNVKRKQPEPMTVPKSASDAKRELAAERRRMQGERKAAEDAAK